MKFKFIFLFLIFSLFLFLILLVNASINTYNSASSNSQVLEWDKQNLLTIPPSGLLPAGTTIDDSRVTSLLTEDGAGIIANLNKTAKGGFRIKFNFTEISNSNFNNETWRIVTKKDFQTGLNLTCFIYAFNFSSSSWEKMSNMISTTYTNYSFSNDINFVNQTDKSSYAFIGCNTSDTTTESLYLDYIEFSVDFNGIKINSPTTNQQILNNLSTNLNVSLAVFNQTIWYTWNNGIKNYTLCTNLNECQSTITFPRTGYYNLTVYGNKSDNTITSQSVNNLFMSNYFINEIWAINPGDQWVNFAYTHDKNWDTYGYGSDSVGFNEGCFYSNYSYNPNLFSFNNIKNWTVKWGGGGNYVFNIIPSNCYNNGNLSLKICSLDYYGEDNKDFYCYNYSSNSYFSLYSSGGQNGIYDENIYDNYSYINIPSILINTLVNNTNFSTSNIILTYNISDDNDYLTNISILLDNVINQTIYSQPINVSINNSLNFTINGISEGYHNWSIRAYDSDNAITNSNNFRILVDTTNPNATLIFPTNNTFNSTTNQNFTVNLTDNLGIKNATLNIWNSTSLVNQTTVSYVPNTLTATIGIVVTLVDNAYNWFYQLFDWSGNSFTTQNNTLTIDTINPQISITSPLSNTNTTSTQLNINYTRSDTNLGACKYTRNNGLTNTTLSGCSNITGVTWYEGLNNITIYINDSAGNINSSSVTFRLDTIAPTINITSPLNTTYKDNYAYNYTLNVTSSDSGVGIQSYWWSLNNGGTNTTFTPNTTLTGLSAGSNTLKVWVNDSVGNTNSSSVIFYLAFTPKINNINISNSSTSYSLNGLNNGLVGWYKFDINNSYKQLDSSIISNNITTFSTIKPSYTDNGKIGGAYYYDRANENNMVIPYHSSINFTGRNISIFYWIYPQNWTGVGDPGILSSVSCTTRNINSIFGIGNKYISFRTFNQSGQDDSLISIKTIEYNAWHQITLIYNGTGKQIWIDGVLDNQINWGYSLRDDSSGLAIGFACNNGYFNGTIDEFRIYNRSLSPSEISNLYSITNPTFQEYSNVTINATITDEDSTTHWYDWFVDNVWQSVSGFGKNIFNIILNKQQQNITLTVNDSNGYFVNQTWITQTTFINPTINFTNPTPTNNTWNAITNVIVNISGTETNLNTAWVKWNNVNYTMSCTGTSPYYCNKTFSSLSENTWYNFTAYINDLVGNNNQTEERKIRLDTTPPVTLATGVSYVFNTWAKNNVEVLLDITDSGVGFNNLAFPLYCLDTTNTCTPNTYSTDVIISTEGISYIRYYANDTLNNNETIKNQTIKIDTISPNLTLINPTSNLNLSFNTSINLNFSVADSTSGIDSCWYTLNSGVINTTILNCLNTTFDSSEGLKTLILYVNDSANNINSTNVSFTVDLTNPNINFTSPTETSGSYINRNNIRINVSVVDTNFANVTVYLYNSSRAINQTNVSLTQPYFINYTGLSDGIYFFNSTSYDFAGNSNSTETRNVTIDMTLPIISYGTNTPVNYANLSQNWVYVNTTWTETNFANITFTLKNDTATVNSTTFTTSTYSINWTNLPDTNYTYFANITDLANNKNSTNIYHITLDTNNSNATLIFPTNNTYNSTTSQNFTFNVSDNLGIKNATLFIYNQTGQYNVTVTNFAINTLQNTVGIVVTLVDNVYNWWVQVWDWAGNSYTTQNNTISIDSIKPAISIVSPSNNTNSSNVNLNVNYTVSDLHLDSCYWNVNGGSNTIITCGTNLTTQTWNQGSNVVTVFANDTYGNVNSSSITFFVDNVAPSLTVYSPVQGSSFIDKNIAFNFSVSDSGIGLDTCWWKNDTDANNITVSCSQNFIFTQSVGTHYVYFWVNDSLNNINNRTIDYQIVSSNITVNLNYPPNAQWLNYGSNINFNFTATTDGNIKNCSLWGNWTGSWHLNKTNSSAVTSGVVYTLLQNISNGYYLWNVECFGDSNSSFALNNRTFGIDSIYPQITFDSNTPVNYYNTTSTSIYAGIILTELNLKNITYYLYNSSSIINITYYTTSVKNITWYNLPNENYYYNVTVYDLADNLNKTESRKITLDNTAPTISIAQPQAINYGSNNSLSLNYSVTDNLIGGNTCRYNLINSSSDVIISTAYSTCQNTTFSLPSEDIGYTLTLFAKDFLTNTNSASVTFGIRTNSPAIVLYPINDTQVNSLNNNYFNFTVSTNANSISNCSLYGNFNGNWSLNQTKTSGITYDGIVKNPFSPLNLTEGIFSWNTYCCDNFNHCGFALNNVTYVTDITYPTVNITQISTTAGSYLITFDSIENDTNLDSCKYSIFNSLGVVDISNNNVSFICNVQRSAIISPFGTYNLTVYTKDKAGNENSSTKLFTISSSGGGGGGGGGIPPLAAPENKTTETFCGDNICQGPQTGFLNGNDKGLLENFWSCPVDCKEGFNFDELFYSLLKYCTDKDQLTPCLWTQGFGSETSTEICGNNICDRSENPFTCSSDCGNFNFNYAFANCFETSGKPCFYNSNMFWYVFFGFTAAMLLISLIQINTPEGRKSLGGYVVLKSKKRYKKYRGRRRR